MERFLLSFLLFFKCFAIFTCQYSSYMDEYEQGLVFIFDTTNSMKDDLEYFRNGSDIILDTITSDPDIPITDYVLVPFNDPDIGPAMISKDKEDLRNAIKNIKVYNVGYNDCDEPSLGGLKLALQTSLISSYIYVMTDAAPKDEHLENDITNLIQRRQSQVVFLVGKGCHKNGYEKYELIAKASSGQIFHLDEASDIYEALKYTNKTLNKDRIDISYVISSRGNFQEEVMVDDTLKSFSAIVSGGNPKLEIFNPKGVLVNDQSTVETIVNLSKMKAVDVKPPSTGVWIVKYGSNETHSLKVTGISKIKLEYGFSAKGAISMSETTHRPLSGANNSILIQIKVGEDSVQKLNTVQVVDSSEKTYHNLELKLVQNSPDSNLYKTEDFQIGDGFFYIVIKGLDKNGNIIKRTSKTAIQVQKPEKPFITLKFSEKIIVINNEINVKMYDKFAMFCIIDSLVPVTAIWLKNDEKINDHNYEQSGEVKLMMDITDKSHEGEYQCKASNVEGDAVRKIKVTVTGETTTKAPKKDDTSGQIIMNSKINLVFSLIFMIYLKNNFNN